jgi:hypothetical protein
LWNSPELQKHHGYQGAANFIPAAKHLLRFRYPAQYGLLSVIVICVFCNSVQITQSNFLQKKQLCFKSFYSEILLFSEEKQLFLKRTYT